MPISTGSSKRYVVLPSYGIAGKAMQASIFQSGSGTSLARELGARVAHMAAGSLTRRLGLTALAATATSEPDALEASHFRVLSQRFADGPAVVSMTEAARLAFQAAYPDLRVLPMTRYHLPGMVPRRNRAAVTAGGIPTGMSAVNGSGQVFLNDGKQQLLRTLNGPTSQRGKGVRIGVVDTGIDAGHPALNRNVTVLRCLIPEVEPTAGGPVNWGHAAAGRAGHGTHVAGILAAEQGHGGPSGVAPEASLISYRVFPDSATGPQAAENAVIIDSIRAAIEDDCHIINLSLEGASLKEDGVRSAISDAWNQGVLCIAAAGNGWGMPVSYPAALPHCVAVTAVGRDGAFPALPEFQSLATNQRSIIDPTIFLAAFSNFGPRVQFTAPGHAIVSTFPGNQWWYDSGTSMAAPFVAGILARLLSDTPAVMGMFGDAQRSAAMLQLLVGRATVLRLPQRAQEGYGLPL